MGQSNKMGTHAEKEMIKRWMTRSEFENYLNDSYVHVGLDSDNVLSLSGIDRQISQFDSKGLVFLAVSKLKQLRTTTVEALQAGQLDDRDEFEPHVNLEVESYAVRKIDNEWKFSVDASEIDAIRYPKD